MVAVILTEHDYSRLCQVVWPITIENSIIFCYNTIRLYSCSAIIHTITKKTRDHIVILPLLTS